MFSANQLCFSTVVNNEIVHVHSLTLGQHICFDPPGLRLAADVLAEKNSSSKRNHFFIDCDFTIRGETLLKQWDDKIQKWLDFASSSCGWHVSNM